MTANSKGSTVGTKLGLGLIAFLGSGCLMVVSDQIETSTTTGGVVVTGGPQVSCVPKVGIFAPTADNTSTMVPIYCSNVGSAASGQNLTINITGTGSFVFTAAFGGSGFPPAGLSPNQSVAIDVTYSPTVISRDEGMLTLSTNGGGVAIPLYALGINSSCRLMIPTQALDFGKVMVGTTSSPLPFAVDNVGSSQCEVAGPLLIANDPSGSFHIVSTSFQPDVSLGAYILSAFGSDPNSRLIVDVDFAPTTTGELSGEVSDLVGLTGVGVAAGP